MRRRVGVAGSAAESSAHATGYASGCAAGRDQQAERERGRTAEARAGAAPAQEQMQCLIGESDAPGREGGREPEPGVQERSKCVLLQNRGKRTIDTGAK